MKERVYEVFARKERGDPLQHIGYLDAIGDELARVYAWRTYDEQNWFEMCIVPRSAIIPVNRSDGPFARSGAPDTAAAPADAPAQESAPDAAPAPATPSDAATTPAREPAP